MAYLVTRNTDSNYLKMEGHKKGSLTIRSQIWLGNIFQYREINDLEIWLWEKMTLVASYTWAVIALKVCWKVTLGHRFDNNFWMLSNFWTRPRCFTKYTFVARIWIQIFYFFGEIERVIIFWICPTKLPEIWIPIICRWGVIKEEV